MTLRLADGSALRSCHRPRSTACSAFAPLWRAVTSPYGIKPPLDERCAPPWCSAPSDTSNSPATSWFELRPTPTPIRSCRSDRGQPGRHQATLRPSAAGGWTDGYRRWSMAAVVPRARFAVARAADRSLPLGSAMGHTARRFPALRRYMAKTRPWSAPCRPLSGPDPAAATSAEVDGLHRIGWQRRALDPGGDLAGWQDLGWVGKSRAPLG